MKRKKLPILGSNPEIQVANQTNHLTVFLFFVIQKHYVGINLHSTISVKGCFNLLVGLPHQCLLLSQDLMESGHHESSFEDQLHAVTNKQEKIEANATIS